MAEQQGPYIGCTLSLISKAKIRYTGVLAAIDTTNATLTLHKVQSHGTEDRIPGKCIPPQQGTYDMILFNGHDIEDLSVVPKDPELMQDPAILNMKKANDKKRRELGRNPQIASEKALKPSQVPKTIQKASQDLPVKKQAKKPQKSASQQVKKQTNRTTSIQQQKVQKSNEPAENNVGSKSKNSKKKQKLNQKKKQQKENQGEVSKKVPESAGDALKRTRKEKAQMKQKQKSEQEKLEKALCVNDDVANKSKKEKQKEQMEKYKADSQSRKEQALKKQEEQLKKYKEEFDFASMNAKFDKSNLVEEMQKMKVIDNKNFGSRTNSKDNTSKEDPVNKNDSDVEDNTATAISAEKEKEPNVTKFNTVEVYYDAKKSFFDNISGVADKQAYKGARKWFQERKLNSETFGIPKFGGSRSRDGYRGHSGFRGGYRGGFRAGYKKYNSSYRGGYRSGDYKRYGKQKDANVEPEVEAKNIEQSQKRTA